MSNGMKTWDNNLYEFFVGSHAVMENYRQKIMNEEPLQKRVKSNVVQSIRAFKPEELQKEAEKLNHHYMYANLANCTSKSEVLETIGKSFMFSKYFGKNFDAVYDCLTETLSKSGSQNGFIVVLEALPSTEKFNKDARETLLDVFRDAADFWAENKVPFRVFYSFAD